MKQHKTVAQTGAQHAVNPLSHPVHQSRFRKFLRLLSEPETILSIGMLAVPPALSLLAAKATQARPPAQQNLLTVEDLMRFRYFS